MQNTVVPNPFENNDNIVTAEIIFNDPLYEPAPALTRSATQNFQPTPRMVPQQTNILLMYQKISKSIRAFKKCARKQSKQADELQDQLTQLEQLLNMQQQSPTPRYENRNLNHRPHPYLNERPLVSSHTPTIQPAAPIYRHELEGFMTEQNEQNILPNSFHPQQADLPETVGFTNDNEIFLDSSQNFEYFNNGNTTYNVEEGL